MKKIFTLLVLLIPSLTHFTQQWELVPNAPDWCQKVSVIGNTLITSHNTGIDKSTDGQNFNFVAVPAVALEIVEANGTLFMGTQGGVYQSTDNGDTWTIDSLGIGNIGIERIYYDGSFLHISTSAWQGVNYFYKDPVVAQWNAPASVQNADSWGPSYEDMIKFDDTLYAETSYGAYFSADNGANWSQVSGWPDVTAFSVHDNKLFIGTYDNFIYVKSPGGSPVTVATNPSPLSFNGITYWAVDFMYSDGSYLYSTQNALNDTSYVYRSNDNGSTWEVLSNEVVAYGINSFANFNGTMYATTRVNGSTNPYSAKLIRFGSGGGQPTSTNELAKSELNLYPNPASNELFIGGIDAPESYRIYSVSGEMVDSGSLSANSPVTFNLTAGLYIISITSAEEIITKQFIVK